MRDECKKWAEVAAKAKKEVTEQQNLVQELRTNVVEKETRLVHFAKIERRVEYSSLQGERRCNC